MDIGQKKPKVHRIPKPIKVKNWPKPSEKPIPVEIPKKETVPIK